MTALVDFKNSKVQAGTSTGTTLSHTCSGSDRVLYVAIAFDTYGGGSPTISGITYNGVAMAPVDDAGGGGAGRRIYVYRLTAPATGVNDIIITWPSTAIQAWVASISLTGADQTTPETDVVIGEDTSADISTPAITSSETDLCLSFAYLNNAVIGDITEGADQTLEEEESGGGVLWISSKAGAAPNQSMSWTNASEAYGLVALSVAESAPAATASIDSSPASAALDSTITVDYSNFSGAITSATIDDGTYTLNASVSDNGDDTADITLPALSHGLILPELGAGKTLTISDGSDSATATIVLAVPSGFTSQAITTTTASNDEKDWSYGLTGLSTDDDLISRDADTFVTHNGDGTSAVSGTGESLVFTRDGSDGALTSITLTYEADDETPDALATPKTKFRRFPWQPYNPL